MTTLERIEAQLGECIHTLTDKLDLNIRQGDTVTVDALQKLTHAWQDISLLMNAERRAAIRGLTFQAIKNGNSPIDALMEYAIESFPRSLTAQRLIKQEVQRNG